MSPSVSVGPYVGRTVDVAAFRGIFSTAGPQLLAQELISSQDNGAILVGIEKLAQKVLVLLFTQTGSQPFAPTHGTDFFGDAQSGRWRTVADVAQSFVLAAADIKAQLSLQALPSDPPDEVFASLTLLGVVLAQTSVSVSIELTSAAGTTYTFLAPITWLTW